MNESLSIPAAGKILMFNKLQKGMVLLFLYEQKVERYDAFKSFIGTGLENKEICLYAFDCEDNKWHADKCFKEYIKQDKLHIVPIENGNKKSMVELNNKFDKIYRTLKKKKEGSFRVLTDFGELTDKNNLRAAIDFDEKILRISWEGFKRIWTKTKYRYKEKTEECFPITAVTAFNASSLNADTTAYLINSHKNVIISTKNEYMISLPNISSIEKSKKSFAKAFSQETMERFVKKHLETVVLCMINDKPLCGYDVIKEISRRYYTFLSQGTVYPLLYSLEKKGVLKVEHAGNKSKVYKPTAEGRKIIQKKLNEFIKTQAYMLGSLRGYIEKEEKG